VAPSVHTEEGDGVGEAQAAIEWRREEVEYEVKANGDANQESEMAVPEIVVDSEIPRMRVLFHAWTRVSQRVGLIVTKVTCTYYS
jgi:hypothetical protein